MQVSNFFWKKSYLIISKLNEVRRSWQTAPLHFYMHGLNFVMLILSFFSIHELDANLLHYCATVQRKLHAHQFAVLKQSSALSEVAEWKMFAERATATKTFCEITINDKDVTRFFHSFCYATTIQFAFSAPLNLNWKLFKIWEFNVAPRKYFFAGWALTNVAIAHHFTLRKLNSVNIGNRFLMLETSWNSYESCAERNYFHLHMNMQPSK